jgi:hypothetical protein
VPDVPSLARGWRLGCDLPKSLSHCPRAKRAGARGSRRTGEFHLASEDRTLRPAFAWRAAASACLACPGGSAPTVRFTSLPAAHSWYSRFAWTTTGTVMSTTCTLGSRPPVSCTSPTTYYSLPTGKHTLTVSRRELLRVEQYDVHLGAVGSLLGRARRTAAPVSASEDLALAETGHDRPAHDL